MLLVTLLPFYLVRYLLPCYLVRYLLPCYRVTLLDTCYLPDVLVSVLVNNQHTGISSFAMVGSCAQLATALQGCCCMQSAAAHGMQSSLQQDVAEAGCPVSARICMQALARTGVGRAMVVHNQNMPTCKQRMTL